MLTEKLVSFYTLRFIHKSVVHKQKMIEFKIKRLFFILICIVSLVMLNTIPIYKTEFFGLDRNTYYDVLILIIIILFFTYNLIILKTKLLKNLLYTTISILISYPVSWFTTSLIIGIFVRLDNQITPLGWQFKYLWFIPIVFTGVLLLTTIYREKKLSK